MTRIDPQEQRLKNIENSLNYLEVKISKIENNIGFNHSGMDSIRYRLEFLENYSFVKDHEELRILFNNSNAETENILFELFQTKLQKMHSLLELPPIYKLKKEPNECNRPHSNEAFDKMEKLYHQTLLVLLFLSPQLTIEFTHELSQLIYHLGSYYRDAPDMLYWYYEKYEVSASFVDKNFDRIYKKFLEIKNE